MKTNRIRLPFRDPILPHKPFREERVGIHPCICLGGFSVDEDESKEEKMRDPRLHSWWVGSEENVVLEPGHVCAEDHDCQ